MDSTLVSVLSSAGVAGVFCLLFIMGIIVPKWVLSDKDKEIEELKDALADERVRAEAATAAADVTSRLLEAIRLGQQLHSSFPPPDLHALPSPDRSAGM